MAIKFEGTLRQCFDGAKRRFNMALKEANGELLNAATYCRNAESEEDRLIKGVPEADEWWLSPHVQPLAGAKISCARTARTHMK